MTLQYLCSHYRMPVTPVEGGTDMGVTVASLECTLTIWILYKASYTVMSLIFFCSGVRNFMDYIN